MNSEEEIIRRTLDVTIPRRQSAFLWGPRKTGKTTLLTQKFPGSLRYDLLETDTFFRLSKQPYLLREELRAAEKAGKLHCPIIIDEVQKIPPLLDEIHWLIENRKINFILCGSSARKRKRSQANLLGGRAWRFELYPLTSHELGDQFDLVRALNQGLIPSHYLNPAPTKTLRAYINDYLKEEIRAEGLARNIPAFARFLDAVSFSNGELVNYSNIARDCGVDAKTVAEYFQILVDTLLGQFIEPFRKHRKRQTITSTPKFYLFDVGVAGELSKRDLRINRGLEFGRAFEHFILMELWAYRSYSEEDFPIQFWRTKEGDEVDFVLSEGRIAIEVKGTEHVKPADTRGIRTFMNEFKPKKALLVCQESVPRTTSSGIDILPWAIFIKKLWNGEITSRMKK